jgi:superfamily II DNA helicase RecQ
MRRECEPVHPHSSANVRGKMPDFHTFFEHLPQYKIIRCRSCQYAVVPIQTERHIRDHHPQIPVAVRRTTAQAVLDLPDIAHQHEDVIYPDIGSEPVPGFPIVTNALRCNGQKDGQRCDYVCAAVRTIQQHCKAEHAWENDQRRGGNTRVKSKHTPNRMWKEGVHCQRFFEYKQWKKVFPVRGGDGDERMRSDPRNAVAAKRLVQRAQDIVDEAEKREDTTRDHFVADPWMEMTGWHRHLRGFDHQSLLAYLRPATGEEGGFGEGIPVMVGRASESFAHTGEMDGLAEACRGTKRLIQHAFTTITPENISKATLQQVARAETGGSVRDFREFYSQQNVKTLRGYMTVWVELLRYIWRTADRAERPEYRITEEQSIHLQRLQQATARHEGNNDDKYSGLSRTGRRDARKTVRSDAIEEASLAFWIAMFDHEMKGHEYDSAIISGLAVIGIRRTGEGFAAAIDYTPKLSAVVTVLRGLVVYRAWKERQADISRYEGEGMSRQKAQQVACGVDEFVREPVRRFMTLMEYGGPSTPMNHILQQRTYGMAIRNTTKAPAKVGWQGDTILIGKVQFTVDDVRKVMFGLCETARRRLVRDLLFIEEEGEDDGEAAIDSASEGRSKLPQLDVKTLFDNEAEDVRGWNFLDDGRNQLTVDGTRWMAERMFAERRIRRTFITRMDGEDVVWKDHGVEKYFRRVRQFKEELMVLVHLSAGAPARATELTSIMSRNPTPGRGRRGVIIDNGLVKFVQGYSKKFRSRKELEIVHRYVPNEVGELVVYFMWLVEPFIKMIRATARGDTKSTPFIWEPPPKEEWKDGENDVEEEVESGSEGGGQADSHGGEVGEGWWSEEERTDPGRLRAEEAQQETPCNVDGYYNTDRVRNTLRRETRERIGVGIGVSDWRHVYPAIQRKYTTDRQVRWVVERLYESGDSGGKGGQSGSEWQKIFSASEVARAMQSNHGPRMEEMMYGGTFEEGDTSVGSEIRALRQVSRDWHRFVGWPSAIEQETDWKTQQQIEVERREAEIKQWQRMRGIDVGKQLREMFGDVTAQFRGVQREALQAIVEEGKRRVLVIMRTGGGKSLMFMLPARGSPQGTTIVVVPTTSLQQDLKKRCSKCFIKCAAWDSNRAPPFGAQIVIVIAESAVTKSFARFINIKRTQGQLDRIVIDECHTILESTAKWRPDVLRLKELSDKGVQVVYLTATLPPSDEVMFNEAVGVLSSDMTSFRESTCRSNVAYSVAEYEKGGLYETIQRLVEEKKVQYPDGKIVIYCRTVVQTEELAGVLGCRAYHREVGSEEEKGELLTGLTEGEDRVFTATNALGLGVDAPKIRLVIHTAVPFKLKQYGQESGRAGRDGGSSEAIIMRWSSIGSDGRKKFEPDRYADPPMRDFIAGESCRRVILDRYMDGRTDRLACDPSGGEKRCDVCSGRPSGRKRRRVFVQHGIEGRICDGQGSDGSLGRSDGARSNSPGEEEDGDDDDNVQRNELVENRQGIETARSELRLRFENERKEEEAVRERRMEGLIGRRKMVERLERQLEVFSNRCVICVARGRLNTDHRSWKSCQTDADTIETFNVVSAWLQKIDFEAYSGCQTCMVPQMLCHLWEDADNREQAQFRRRVGGKCQFEGVLVEAVSALMTVRSDVTRAWLEERTHEQEGRIGGAHDDIEKKRRWLGLRFKMHEGVEISGLCVMFCEFAADQLRGEGGFTITVASDEEDEEDDEEEGEGGEEELVGSEGSMIWRKDARDLGAVLDPGWLRKLTEGWKDQCVLCRIRGRNPRDHWCWSECDGRDEDKGKMEEAINLLDEVRFADFSQCKWCHRSQAVCELWDRTVGWQSRVVFKKKTGIECRYGRWVLEAAAGFLAFKAEEGLEDWRQRDPTLRVLKGEMGKKYRRGEVELSGMFMYFCKWA